MPMAPEPAKTSRKRQFSMLGAEVENCRCGRDGLYYVTLRVDALEEAGRADDTFKLAARSG